MTPAPISILDNSFETSENYMNCRLNTRDMDQKAVGGHLPVGKRNSTPVSCGFSYNDLLKAILSAPVSQTRTLKSPSVPTCDITCSSHRRLDRSQSEPMRVQLPSLQQQQQPGTQSGSSRYKTELCRPFAETGYCKYGEKCQFAHGKNELRNMTRHPKYKTELCRTFHSTGLCGYGSRCHFIHNSDERRGPVSPPNGLASASTQASITALSSGLSQKNAYMSNDDHLFGMSPPQSLHGSPTTNGALFFDTLGGLLPVKDFDIDVRTPEHIDNYMTPPSSPSNDPSETDAQRLAIFRNLADIFP